MINIGRPPPSSVWFRVFFSFFFSSLFSVIFEEETPKFEHWHPKRRDHGVYTPLLAVNGGYDAER